MGWKSNGDKRHKGKAWSSEEGGRRACKFCHVCRENGKKDWVWATHAHPHRCRICDTPTRLSPGRRALRRPKIVNESSVKGKAVQAQESEQALDKKLAVGKKKEKGNMQKEAMKAQ